MFFFYDDLACNLADLDYHSRTESRYDWFEWDQLSRALDGDIVCTYLAKGQVVLRSLVLCGTGASGCILISLKK